MDKLYEDSETGCCPRFNPEPWEEKEITWDNKLFVKDKFKSFFKIPINFGKVVVRNAEKIKAADALLDQPIMLCDDKSFILIGVSKEVPNTEMEKVTGTFLTKVFEGSYKDMGKWIKETGEYVKAKDKEVKKFYYFYTTCPRCAKTYGKNYTVILAQV